LTLRVASEANWVLISAPEDEDDPFGRLRAAKTSAGGSAEY